MFKCFAILVFALAALVSCERCRTGEPEFFFQAFAPCDVCIAVRMVNKKTNTVIAFDSQMVQTLRNVNDSLIIRRNGVITVELSNFKERMALTNREKRTYYFQSITGSGTKTIRFVLTSSEDAPLMTSLIMEGEYNPAIDTVDIYYRRH